MNSYHRSRGLITSLFKVCWDTETRTSESRAVWAKGSPVGVSEPTRGHGASSQRTAAGSVHRVESATARGPLWVAPGRQSCTAWIRGHLPQQRQVWGRSTTSQIKITGKTPVQQDWRNFSSSALSLARAGHGDSPGTTETRGTWRFHIWIGRPKSKGCICWLCRKLKSSNKWKFCHFPPKFHETGTKKIIYQAGNISSIGFYLLKSCMVLGMLPCAFSAK